MKRPRHKTVFTITPNPALDLSGMIENLKPNEKTYVHNELRSPGGNSINSARILNRLGTPVIASGFLGGSTGNEIKSLLQNEKLRCQFIALQDSSRINVTVSNKHTHEQTRLSFPGPTVRIAEARRLVQLLQTKKNISFLLLGGSLPKGYGPENLTELIEAAHKKGIKTVIDCPGKILAKVIGAKPFLIKPNLEEFHELTSSRVRTIPSVIKKGTKLLRYTQYLCVSSVEGGTLLMSDKHVYFGRIPRIKVRSSVGAGDSMVGAMVDQWARGNPSDEQVLRWGLGAAAATLIQPGTTLGTAKDIHRLSQSAEVHLIKILS